jgi:hypothetical protein
MPGLRFTPILLAACILVAGSIGTASATIEKAVIVIDSSTIQPVATGLVPPATDYNFIFLADGGARVVPVGLSDGWFGATGETRLNRGGEVVPDEPYGCILADFNTVLSNSWYVPSGGSLRVQISDVGNELHVGLNMSDTDLTNMNGKIAITVFMVQEDFLESSVITIDSQTTQPIQSGFVAAAGDQFILAARGALNVLSTFPPLFEGWFGPPGAIRLSRGGQINQLPYGAVLGTFNLSLASSFYVGDGGTWTTQPADVGDELLLGVNMSDADLASSQGRFLVQVIRIPEKTTAVGPGTQTVALGLRLGQATPNPMNPSSSIRYSVAQDGPVLLRVYDAAGRHVRTLIDENRAAGEHSVQWLGQDDAGNDVASGTYFYQLTTAAGSQTQKLVVTR